MKITNSEIKFSLQNKNYLNFPIIHQHTSKKTVHRSSSCSSFLDRNYNKFSQEQKSKRAAHAYILSQDNLNALLCKLKNYYNEVLCTTTARQRDLNILRDSSDVLNYQHNQLVEFQDIELPDEKISVKNFNELKCSKEEIENTVRNLIKEKDELDYKYKNELEYSKTIEYMYEKEKSTLEKIHDVTKQTEERIATIQKYQKNLDDNLNERKKKKQNFVHLLEKLTNDINMIENVVKNQTKKSNDLDSSIIQKEADNEDFKERIKTNHEKQINEIKKYKENIKHQIIVTNDKVRTKIENEKNYIKTILCLELIQKFFINKDEFNMNELLESKEYKDFKCDRLTLFDEDNKVIFNSEFNNGTTSHNVASIRTRSNFSKTTSNFGATTDKKLRATQKQTRISLNELKQKFDNLNLTSEALFEYHSKINNKINFYRNTLINYNNKQIQLENKKDKCYVKVKEIVNKDYKNFEDLIKNNSRFEDFINTNQSLIRQAKEHREVAKIKKVRQAYTSKELKENEDKELITQTPLEVMSLELYKNCHSILRENKNFFETIGHQCSSLIKKQVSTNSNRTSLSDEASKLNDKITIHINALNSYSILQFEKYIKELYSYIDDNNLKVNIKDNSINLLEYFYTDKKYTKPNHKFIRQFLKKDIPIESEMLHNLVYKTKTISLLDDIFTFITEKSKEIPNKRYIQSPEKKNQDSSSSNNLNTSNSGTNVFNNNIGMINFELSKNDPMKTIRTKNDEDDSFSDAETTQHEVKAIKKRNSSMDEKIIKKLYEPHLAKTFYIRRLNGNMKQIKGMTNISSKTNFALCKKRSEVEEMSKRLVIYNNPKINVSELSNETYNSVLNYIFQRQNKQKNQRKYMSKSFYNKDS